MRIVSYNVNGIRSIIPSRFATLGDLLNSLGNPNIFCAQESKLVRFFNHYHKMRHFFGI
jgi:exonuclease III